MKIPCPHPTPHPPHPDPFVWIFSGIAQFPEVLKMKESNFQGSILKKKWNIQGCMHPPSPFFGFFTRIVHYCFTSDRHQLGWKAASICLENKKYVKIFSQFYIMLRYHLDRHKCMTYPSSLWSCL